MFDTPILFLIFNRPELTRIVFDRIREIRPKRLYVAADGPRRGNYADAISCRLTREAIKVDWDCELNLLFREENLGCGKAVSGAITWFFEQEEKGIVLEDDCLPAHSFFPYCKELLDKYEHDERVFHIGGVNFQDGIRRGKGSYYFSAIPHIWGWATWRRAWKKYDFNIRNFGSFNRENRIDAYHDDASVKQHWLNTFKAMSRHSIDTWDHQWTFAMLDNGALAITPNLNLVTNIGFGADATHTTTANQYADVKANEIQFPLQHPEPVKQDKTADHYFYKEVEKLIPPPLGLVQRLKGTVVSGLEDFLRTNILPKVQRRSSNRILLVKPDAIGDMFICQWLFNALENYPDRAGYEFYLLAHIRLKSYLDAARLPFIKEVIYYDPKVHMHFKPLYGFYFQLRKYKFRKVYNLLYSRTKAVDEIVHYTGAPEKIGFDGDFANSKPSERQVTDRYYTSLYKIPNDEQRVLHESERMRLFFEQMMTGSPIASFKAAYLKPLTEQENMILICPGSNEDYKKWSPLNYAQLIGLLQAEHPNVSFKVMCGPGEEKLGAIIKENCPAAEVMKVNDIHQLIGLVNRAKLVVSNDSAPVHIALAYGRPFVCVFNGSRYDRFVPYPGIEDAKYVTVMPDEVEKDVKDEKKRLFYHHHKVNIHINSVTVEKVHTACKAVLNLKSS